MKFLILASLAIVAVLFSQAFGDEESWAHNSDQSSNYKTDSLDKNLEDLKNGVNGLAEKSFKKYQEIAEGNAVGVKGVMSNIRQRRSPQTFADSQKSKTDEALEKLSDSYSDLKENVGSLVANITDSKLAKSISSSFDKFKATLGEASNTIKETIHNHTAPASKESKESEESH